MLVLCEAAFYVFIGNISSFLKEEKLARSALYLANFFLEMKQTSTLENWSISKEIDIHWLLANSESSFGGDILRAFKIMDSARKLAISAGAPGITELERINWIMAFLKYIEGDLVQAEELSA